MLLFVRPLPRQSQIYMFSSDGYNLRRLPMTFCTYSSDRLYQMEVHLQSIDNRPYKCRLCKINLSANLHQ
ncbi:uncharacterized protein DS421_6g190950 [Arachis hypogaea]|nr:uncharacterized protein DS421_6g190950 [Arachis hypogaea]